VSTAIDCSRQRSTAVDFRIDEAAAKAGDEVGSGLDRVSKGDLEERVIVGL